MKVRIVRPPPLLRECKGTRPWAYNTYSTVVARKCWPLVWVRRLNSIMLDVACLQHLASLKSVQWWASSLRWRYSLTLLLLQATYLDHVMIMWLITIATGVEVPGCQKLVGDVGCLQRAIHSVPGQVYLEGPGVAGLSERYVPYMSKFSRWINPLSTDGHYSGHLAKLFFIAELANLTLAHWLP